MPAAGRRRLVAVAALLLTTIAWGGSFVWMKQAHEEAARVAPAAGGATVSALFVTLRFALAAVLLPLASARARRLRDARVQRYGAALGAIMLGGYGLQMMGLGEVTPPVSAFLTSLYVVFTAAIVAWRGHAVTRPLLAGAALSTLGAAFIEGPPHVSYGFGEAVTLACAALFALHIVATDHCTRRADPIAIAEASFLWLAAGGALLLAACVARSGAPPAAQLAALLGSPRFLTPLALCAVPATAIAVVLFNLYQRELHPVRAAVLYALEPVWATLYAFAAGLDHPGPWLLAGGALLLAGNLVVELAPRRSGSFTTAS